MLHLIFLFFAIPSLALASAEESFLKLPTRKNIQIVGSSTVYPFVATIAENFGRETEFRTPIVEATGTGGGFKLFCSGVGYQFPDFVNASRKIEKSEVAKCQQNKITPGEIKIGYDGIVLANSKSGKKYSLTKKQIFLALAEKVPDKNEKIILNPYKKWSDIDKSLPKTKIKIYGPPTTSGTRDSFTELSMEKVCKENPAFIKAYPDDKIRSKKCRLIRSDGYFIEAGENDNLIVQKLRNDSNALGIFGFSFLEENYHTIQAASIDGVDPTFENIASGRYEISRPLFIYFKKEHLKFIHGMHEFINEIVSKNTVGKNGYLLQKGLIPLSDQEIEKMRKWDE